MTENEIIDFYKNSSDAELINKADEVCRMSYGDKVYLRGLVEFSNYCNMDCLYCGIRKSNSKVVRYRLSPEQILEIVKKGFKAGLKTFVLQSGEDNFYDSKNLALLTEKIKKETSEETAITLSCGIMTRSGYNDLKNAGCDRYLMRFETSDEKLHQYLRNGISLKRRLKALNDLKELGFETGSGYMVGLPDETEEIRINNALLCKKLELDMVGIGPFIPHPDTPLKDAHKNNIELAVRATALLRILLPYANIPATTASGTIDKNGREKILKAGANVLMPNITPSDNKKNYLLYPDKICVDESGFQCITCLTKRVSTVSKKIVMDRGDSLSNRLKMQKSFL